MLVRESLLAPTPRGNPFPRLAFAVPHSKTPLVRESFLAPTPSGNPFPRPSFVVTFNPMTRYVAGDNLPYFCTITILDWVPVFIDQRYIDPVINSLVFCRRSKGLQLFAYVIMPNHLHLIAAAGDLHAVIRDFKRFTSRSIHELLMSDQRRAVLDWLERAAQGARRGRGEFSFWQDGFHPQAISTRSLFEQKLAYLHDNPVRKGLVRAPVDWRCSSAGWYAGDKLVPLAMDSLLL